MGSTGRPTWTKVLAKVNSEGAATRVGTVKDIEFPKEMNRENCFEPLPDFIEVDVVYDPSIEFSVTANEHDWRSLGEGLKEGFVTDISFDTQVVKPVFPDWVWWTPKPENYDAYKTLGLYSEKVEVQRLAVPKAIIKAMEHNGGLVTVHFEALSEIIYLGDGQ